MAASPAHFEIVAHRTPVEGIRYHGRLKVTDSDRVLWRTELYTTKDGVHACINVAKAYAAGAPVIEVVE
jgi:uncharacterized protein YegP (UPF0339 family)